MYRPPRNTPLYLPRGNPVAVPTQNGTRKLQVPPSGKCENKNVMEIDSKSDCDAPTITHDVETPMHDIEIPMETPPQ